MRRISYEHPNYREIEDRVRKQFGDDFNNLPLGVVEKYYDHDLSQHIINLDVDIVVEEWLDNISYRDEVEEEYKDDQGMYYPDDRTPFLEWVGQAYRSEVDRYWNKNNHYPMWGTVFEVKSSNVRQKIMENINELYDIGIGVISGKDDLDYMLFINGAGYDFYEAHWIPMYILFDWLDESLLEV